MLNDRAGKPEGAKGVTLPGPLAAQPACGIIIVGQNQKIAAVGGDVSKALGLSPDAKILDLADLPATLQSHIRQALASGKRNVNHNIELTPDEGGKQTLCVSVLPLDSGNRSAGTAVVLSEPNGFKHFEENLRRLDLLASLGTLSASMAHEIKNALVAGKTFIDLLLEKHQDTEFVETVRREMQRIDSIVSRVLRFTGPALPSLTPVHLHDVLDHSLRLVQPQAESKSIGLNREFLATNDLVNGDDHQLQQAFVNLLLNALEATPENGTLSLTTADLPKAKSRGQVCVTIEDSGPGIAPEHMERLFEPFFTTKPDGTGLGLAITQRIVQEHNGTIQVESAPGKGATFRLIFPAREPRV